MTETKTSQADAIFAMRLIWFVPIVALLIALMPLPYGYYILLRWLVCAAALWAVYVDWEVSGKSVSTWTILMAVVAVLFNPIAPIFMDRAVWAFVDVGVAGMFYVHWRALRNRASVDKG